MNDDREKIKTRYPADTETRFFGTITASVTHELNNVMSIISQTGGLLEDLLAGQRLGREIPLELLQRIADKVAAQTERSIEIINRLNRFAHGADEPEGVFNLTETLLNIGQLAERLVILRGAVLSLPPDDMTLEMEGHQFKIQQLVFLAFLAILPEMQKGDNVDLTLDKANDAAHISIKLDRNHACEPLDMLQAEVIAEEIGAEIISDRKESAVSIDIRLPLKLRKDV